METLIERSGSYLYRWLISFSNFYKIVALLSTFDQALVNEKDKQNEIRIIIVNLFKMLAQLKYTGHIDDRHIPAALKSVSTYQNKVKLIQRTVQSVIAQYQNHN